ncbi:hypothetical protein ANN_19708 [Periplaneta americana]|uniref:Uncharacterized protein n=1 Tax=Periplaneta americana TaxID=6978 RepID=A0ABQ8SAM9_PERAM|nr:hypothetical protein ANN_19708 [Periplaneta americana]
MLELPGPNNDNYTAMVELSAAVVTCSLPNPAGRDSIPRFGRLAWVRFIRGFSLTPLVEYQPQGCVNPLYCEGFFNLNFNDADPVTLTWDQHIAGHPPKTTNLKRLCETDIYITGVLYGCETWTLTLREGQRLTVSENKVLRKIFGAKRDEVTGEWRKLHNAELHALYSSPDIIRYIKSRRLRWAGHVARMDESRNAYRMLVGRPEGKRPSGRPRRRWEDNIKMNLREMGYDDRDWINLAQDRDRWRAYERATMNLWVP